MGLVSRTYALGFGWWRCGVRGVTWERFGWNLWGWDNRMGIDPLGTTSLPAARQGAMVRDDCGTQGGCWAARGHTASSRVYAL